MVKPLSRIGGAVLLCALGCGMTKSTIERGGLAEEGGQVHLYGEAAMCVP